MNISWIKTKGRTFDPIQLKFAAQKQYNNTAKQDYAGQSPNVFIGHYGYGEGNQDYSKQSCLHHPAKTIQRVNNLSSRYPKVNVGFLNTEHYTIHDEPLTWKKQNTSIPEIIKLRTNLINASFKAGIKDFNNKFLQQAQEISQAKRPVDMDIQLKNKPQFKLSMSQETKPHGPRTDVKKATLTQNPYIHKHIDKAVSDTDWKAADAMSYLFKKGFDEHKIIKLLTLGNLGIGKQRKLVPTRWGITATHSTIGNQLVQNIKQYETYEYAAFFGSYLGNYYLILTLPDVWQYELFETIIKENAHFATNYEPYYGRKSYATETAGGFYTVRMACLEQLKIMKRQASMLALRFIDPKEYIAPLGVWVTLEAARNAMQSKPIVFSSKELLFNYARILVKKKFGMDVNTMLAASKVIQNTKQQKLHAFT